MRLTRIGSVLPRSITRSTTLDLPDRCRTRFPAWFETCLLAVASDVAAQNVMTMIGPTSGLPTGGTVVTITGAGFSTTAGATSVTFGATAATGVSCSSATRCTATALAGTNTISVRVTVGGQASADKAADNFTTTNECAP